MRLTSPLRRFARDKRGVTAVEFALVAPAVLIVYFAMTQVILAMAVERRASHVASAIADLAAQNATMTASDITALMSIGPTIMEPFGGEALKMRLSSMTVDADGDVSISWSRGDTITNGVTAASLPADLKVANSAYIVGEVEYHYPISLAPGLLKGVFKDNADGWTFKRHFFYKPRRGSEVTCSGC